MVIMREAFNWRIPSQFRNTANSLSSLFFRLTFFVFGPLVGFIIDRYGMNVGLYSLGGVYFCLIFVLMLPMLRHIPKVYKEKS